MPDTTQSPAAHDARLLIVAFLFMLGGVGSPVARSVALAQPDMLPIAVVLGAGVLAWLLGNRRPRLQPARPRKPEPKGRRG